MYLPLFPYQLAAVNHTAGDQLFDPENAFRELAVKEEAKKTSIHLVRKSAFAGVAIRKSALILTLKSDSDVPSKRIAKREHVSANRWYFEVKLEGPGEVDREIQTWLKKAYELAG